jgi:hypothetical protein
MSQFLKNKNIDKSSQPSFSPFSNNDNGVAKIKAKTFKTSFSTPFHKSPPPGTVPVSNNSRLNF